MATAGVAGNEEAADVQPWWAGRRRRGTGIARNPVVSRVVAQMAANPVEAGNDCYAQPERGSLPQGKRGSPQCERSRGAAVGVSEGVPRKRPGLRGISGGIGIGVGIDLAGRFKLSPIGSAPCHRLVRKYFSIVSAIGHCFSWVVGVFM